MTAIETLEAAFAPADFNPTPTAEGFALWEHWETGKDGEHYLLLVSSSSVGMTLKPGDFILHRAWAPASTPVVRNHARGEASE